MGESMSQRVMFISIKRIAQFVAAFIPFLAHADKETITMMPASHHVNDVIQHAKDTTYHIMLDDVWHGLYIMLTQTNWLNVAHLAGRILVILVFSYMFMRLIDKIIHALAPRLSRSKAIHAHSSVINTILPIMRSILMWTLGVVTLLILLSELGFNITPLIYSLSVVGLAVSFGSQNLVKDFLNGVMTLIEGSMAVGDEVIVGNYKGVVESMSLRYVHIRHEMGALHIIPFSEVNTITNVSRDYAKIIFSLICTPAVSLSILEQIFNDVYQDLKSQDVWKDALSHSIEFQGIKRVTAQGLEVVAHLKTAHATSKALTYAFYNKLLPLCQEREVPLVFGVSDPEMHTNQYVVY